MRYQRLIICFSILLVSFTTALTTPAADEILNNASVIELQNLNMGDAVIIEKINTSKCDFDTSIAGLKQLKTANVSAPVIQAIVAAKTAGAAPGDPNDPATPHAAGIWVMVGADGKNKMTQLTPEVPAEISSGGFIGPWGIGKVATTARLTGMESQLQLSQSKPEFYIYFKDAAMEFSGASSPQEITLAHLTVLGADDKHNPNQRAVDVAVHGAYGGSYGVDRKAVRAFDATVVADGIYKIVPKADLADGEYAFCAGSGAAAMTGQYQYLTFGIHSK